MMRPRARKDSSLIYDLFLSWMQDVQDVTVIPFGNMQYHTTLFTYILSYFYYSLIIFEEFPSFWNIRKILVTDVPRDRWTPLYKDARTHLKMIS